MPREASCSSRRPCPRRSASGRSSWAAPRARIATASSARCSAHRTTQLSPPSMGSRCQRAAAAPRWMLSRQSFAGATERWQGASGRRQHCTIAAFVSTSSARSSSGGGRSCCAIPLPGSTSWRFASASGGCPCARSTRQPHASRTSSRPGSPPRHVTSVAPWSRQPRRAPAASTSSPPGPPRRPLPLPPQRRAAPRARARWCRCERAGGCPRARSTALPKS
mmetsp:Transcript_23733/g.63486  ORF Transcript_23733/g.63486 Transcript_23733/m.63486 type:complete len:221 (+) Transcript_23733:2932-3594(+)